MLRPTLIAVVLLEVIGINSMPLQLSVVPDFFGLTNPIVLPSYYILAWLFVGTS